VRAEAKRSAAGSLSLLSVVSYRTFDFVVVVVVISGEFVSFCFRFSFFMCRDKKNEGEQKRTK
jgi:hypothetical protein